jgi:hypothetical protein
MERSQLYQEVSNGKYGQYKLEIFVSATKLPDLDDKRIKHAVYDAVDLINDAFTEVLVEEDPNTAIKAAKQRRLY